MTKLVRSLYRSATIQENREIPTKAERKRENRKSFANQRSVVGFSLFCGQAHDAPEGSRCCVRTGIYAGGAVKEEPETPMGV